MCLDSFKISEKILQALYTQYSQSPYEVSFMSPILEINWDSEKFFVLVKGQN